MSPGSQIGRLRRTDDALENGSQMDSALTPFAMGADVDEWTEPKKEDPSRI